MTVLLIIRNIKKCYILTSPKINTIKTKKVIQLIDSLSPGGAEVMAVNIANALEERGVDSHLCATRLEGDLISTIHDNVGYLFLNKKKIIDFKAILKLYNYIRNHQISIIHAHSSSFFLAFLVKLINWKIKIVWHDHYGNSENLANRKKFYLQVASYFFSSIIVVNKLLFNWNKSFLKVKNIILLPNFATLSDKKQLTILKGEVGKRIVCLANFRPQKDHLNLLKAFNSIHQKHKDWTVHLVGGIYNDWYAKEVSAFIKNNKLEKHVFLYGTCNDTGYILSQSTIGVLSSKSEGLPISLLEYGLKKLPVVVTNVGDCAKVVLNGNTGYIVEPNDEASLASAINNLIEDTDKRKIFGNNLYERVQQHFSEKKYIDTLLKIYN